MERHYAFFDVDGTILNIKTMFSFLRFYFKKTSSFKILGLFKYHLKLSKIIFLYIVGKDRSFINAYFYKIFSNKKIEEIKQYCKCWYQELISDNSKIWRHDVIQKIRWHQSNNGIVVMVSGSMKFCLIPIAEKLSVDYVIATELEEYQGILTGKIIGDTIIGQGKVEKIKLFLKKQSYDDIAKCYVYGDHESDIPMMSLVGNPTAIRGNKHLEKYALNHGWKII